MHILFQQTSQRLEKGQAPTAITCFGFGEDKALCVVETLKGYIHR